MPHQRLQRSNTRTSMVLVSIIAASPLAMGVRRASVPPAIAPGHVAATGRIEGTVLLSTTLTTHRPRFRIYAEPGPGARPPARLGDEMRNVVLYVQRAAVAEGFTPARGTMSQRDGQFVPHVLPVIRGATAEFPNADDVFHNVFSLSSAKTFDLGRYPSGTSKSVTFETSGTVQVFCHIHSDMSAIVLVLDNPYFAVPSDSGRYAIDGLPPGDYIVVGWHERITPVSRNVHVVAGETARLDFNIPIPSVADDVGH